MKNVVLLLLITVFLNTQISSQTGINFSKVSWQEMLLRAEQEKKLIFIDAFTEWCGPCKMMARDVFPLEEVGSFFNRQFINAKIDMEKGEGIGLAQKYSIYAYPSLLFVDGKGEVVHRAVGYHAPDMLIDLGKAALDSEKNILGFKTQYLKGNRKPDFLRQYAMATQQAMMPDFQIIAMEYLETQTDWSSAENMDFIFLMMEDIDSEMFEFMLKNKKAFETKYGDRAVTGKIEQLIQYKLMMAESESDLEKIENAYTLLDKANAKKTVHKVRMNFYSMRENWPQFFESAKSYFESYDDVDWTDLNEAAWIVFTSIEDVSQNKTALEWTKKSMKINSNYYNNDTAASLYYKLGKNRKALKAANKAIKYAQKDGEDYSSTEILIQKINDKY
jgi:thiol-disulfide isomerase/thioredoxin